MSNVLWETAENKPIRFLGESPFTYSHTFTYPEYYRCVRSSCVFCLLEAEFNYRALEQDRWVDDGGMNPADSS